jgi:hypothetical protein
MAPVAKQTSSGAHQEIQLLGDMTDHISRSSPSERRSLAKRLCLATGAQEPHSALLGYGRHVGFGVDAGRAVTERTASWP